MTTNVFDRVHGILSSDSRWSSESGDWVAYVDDTSYDKLASTSRVGFLFAGDMPQVDAWKKYVANGMKSGTRPKVHSAAEWIPGNRISVIQVEFATKRSQESHPMLSSTVGALVRAMYAGTGATPAKECWDERKCAKTAIVSASKKDNRSGGAVVFLDCETGIGNVVNAVSAQSVQEQLKDRGYLMNSKHNQYAPILLKDAAKDDSNPVAQMFAQSVMSGATPLTAPFSNMDEPWSPESLAEFDAMLSEFETD